MNWQRELLDLQREDRKEPLMKTPPELDYSCKVCGVQCDLAPDPPARAVCEQHCEDHEYIFYINP